jgi:uncharacterized protein YacL
MVDERITKAFGLIGTIVGLIIGSLLMIMAIVIVGAFFGLIIGIILTLIGVPVMNWNRYRFCYRGFRSYRFGIWV